MSKIRFHLVVYRYELIIALLILILSGSIAISSRDGERAFPPPVRYPYSIALTFDDGPHQYYTDKILEILAANNIHATFFIVGTQALKFPDLLKKISVSGSELGNHTVNHRNLKHLSDAEIEQELLINNRIIKDITGQDAYLYRPPGGQYDEHVINVAGKYGMKMVLWSVFSKDYQEPSEELIKERVFSQASDGGVILLHSGVEATLKVLPQVISGLKAKGFRFVTVSELLGSEPGNKYAWLK